MKRDRERPLKAVIEEFIDSYHLRGKLNETKVIQAWERVVGAVIAKNTRSLYIRNRTLYLRVNSSALRNELLYARSKIVKSLNKEVGTSVIDELVIQ